jgi:broad specificity phosphatase PhoE
MLTAPLRTVVYVVRHAEVHNPKDIVYGRLPRFGLSARGRLQAEAAARFFAQRPIDALYTSPLLRARQTADSIHQALPGVKLRRTKRLLEVRTGYQGSPNSILVAGFSFYEPLVHDDDERMSDVLQRMAGFLRFAVRNHAGGAVAGVSHADPIAILRLGLENRELTVKNLHSVVYPERVSVNQIVLGPDHPPQLTYFDVAGTLRPA